MKSIPPMCSILALLDKHALQIMAVIITVVLAGMIVECVRAMSCIWKKDQ